MCQRIMWLPFDLMKWRRFHCGAVLVGTLSLRNRSQRYFLFILLAIGQAKMIITINQAESN
ncbi:CDN_1a_G0004000.mRNA.1.CDS.1 [Saccharomyces cerevisiae]|nr:CDN_1a_G0004000.mRNA.1.CDS.1 [Saccharomyces cerevisiae]CAI7154759.1 CDN_1a_G0004000.mRNA.1.CDS.1 [Saccharomyces cerevisiae]